METKNCQNCKNDFTIEADDFNFYEKIKVPAPTFCPECRLVRRLIWRNERSLYKRTCDLCGKNIISMYSAKNNFPIFCPECWRSDSWDPMEYGQDYDFSKTFFQQFKELFDRVPRQAVWQLGKCINSEYANFVKDVKNTYLSYSTLLGSEDVYYSSNIDNSKEIVDSYNIINSEFLYENIGSTNNYNCQYSYWSSSCIDCSFVLDCANCSNCFACVNLRNKSYCIWNKQYSKEEYFEKIKDFNMGNYKFTEKTFTEFWDFALKLPRKYTRMVNCVNSNGDELRDSKNVSYCFKGHDNENMKYCYRITHAHDSMDVCHSWAELAYEHAHGGSENSQNIKFVINGAPALNEVEYVDLCQSSRNIFACIGVKNKQYCIFNKQYEKEKYFEMVEKIKKHMEKMPYVDKKGRVYKYGEFFPYELSPFGYDEAVINDHFPLTKEEILNKGYWYADKKDNEYTITRKASDLPDDIKNVDETILNDVIECAISKRAFRITKFELQFYKRMNIPLPRIHQDERYKKRISFKNPMKLWHRHCMKEGCTNKFETSYAPDRPEIIYCESCYNKEVY